MESLAWNIGSTIFLVMGTVMLYFKRPDWASTMLGYAILAKLMM